MGKRCFRLYCVVIALVVALPLFGTTINFCAERLGKEQPIKEGELNGVTDIPAKPRCSVDSFLSGQFESEFEDWFAYNLVGRRVQTKIYNQLLYSVFHSTDNRDMLVGRDNYLFEKSYATAYLEELTPGEIQYIQENVNKLVRLSELLGERGIPLVIRMSPSKAEHYPEFLPASYDRFVKMKQDGAYGPNWYQAFCEEIRKTDIPVYDRYELMEQMKRDGEIVFAKGGTHWTLAPMAEYINGLNECLESVLDCSLGRMVVESETTVNGVMGTVDDSDIWKICWNAPFAEPNYPSPHISYSTTAGNRPIRVFTVGQSFTTLLLSTIYGVEQPVWEETLFSWYNTRVIQYPSDVPWGTEISKQTDDYERYLDMDVILIDLIECGTGWSQFAFVDNMLQYLEKNEAAL